MKFEPLAFRLGLTTLRSRPTLTVLAIMLLSIGSGLLGAIIGTTRILENLQATYLSALTLDVELTPEAEINHATLMSKLEGWPETESVRFVGKEEVLGELQKETSDDLYRMFGSNPFPSLLRVRFNRIDLPTLDSLESAIRAEPGVQNVMFPREIWRSTDKFLARLKGDVGLFALGLALISVSLVGLCLRAQVRNRRSAWELLSLIGLSDRTFGLALLVQELAVGLAAGLIACFLLSILVSIYSWLFLRSIGFEFWIYLVTILMAMSLSLVAGLMTPRRASA